MVVIHGLGNDDRVGALPGDKVEGARVVIGASLGEEQGQPRQARRRSHACCAWPLPLCSGTEIRHLAEVNEALPEQP